MPVEIITTIVAGLVIAVGIMGIVVPVLPGSPLIALAVLVWAIIVGGPFAWIATVIAIVFVAVGWSYQYIHTGTRLKRHDIPNRSLIIAAAAGIVGIFVIPVVGLVIGFLAGLFLAELARKRDAKLALDSSWIALKAAGVGMLIEFGCACLAALSWGAGMFVHFVTVPA